MSISAQRGPPQSWARRFLRSEALPRAGRGDFCATEATSAVPRVREVAGRKSYGIAFAPGDRLALLVLLAPPACCLGKHHRYLDDLFRWRSAQARRSFASSTSSWALITRGALSEMPQLSPSMASSSERSASRRASSSDLRSSRGRCAPSPSLGRMMPSIKPSMYEVLSYWDRQIENGCSPKASSSLALKESASARPFSSCIQP